MTEYVTFEHPDYEEIQVMTREEFNNGNRHLIEEASNFVWQKAVCPEQARVRHMRKHDEWYADIQAGRPEKWVY